MFCQIAHSPTATATPVYVHVPHASENLPATLPEALARHARIYTLAEIDGMYPEPLLQEMNSIIPNLFDMNATMSAFGKLTPELQNLAITVATGNRHITSLVNIIAWPSLQQELVTIMDMVAQQCVVEDEASSYLDAHASWLRAVQDHGYPAFHALYPNIGIEDENIGLALQNWPHIPPDVRNFLHWNDHSLFNNIKRHTVYVCADPNQQDPIAAKLSQYGVRVTAERERATVHVCSHDPTAAAEAMQYARERDQPCYLVSTPDDARVAELQRLEAAGSVLNELRSLHEDQMVEHSIADVQALLDAIIPHYPPTTSTQHPLL